jgi:hypothetical protein
MSDPSELRRLLGDLIIKIQDKHGPNAYPGTYAKEIEDEINSGALPIFRVRDTLWCNALMILDPRDIQEVLNRFNKSRPDME